MKKIFLLIGMCILLSFNVNALIQKNVWVSDGGQVINDSEYNLMRVSVGDIFFFGNTSVIEAVVVTPPVTPTSGASPSLIGMVNDTNITIEDLLEDKSLWELVKEILLNLSVTEDEYNDIYEAYYGDNFSISMMYAGAGITPEYETWWGVDLLLENIRHILTIGADNKYAYSLKRLDEREKEFLKCLAHDNEFCANTVNMEIDNVINFIIDDYVSASVMPNIDLSKITDYANNIYLLNTIRNDVLLDEVKGIPEYHNISISLNVNNRLLLSFKLAIT